MTLLLPEFYLTVGLEQYRLEVSTLHFYFPELSLALI